MHWQTRLVKRDRSNERPSLTERVARQIAAAADSAVRGTMGGAPDSTGRRRKTPRYSVGDGGGKPLAHAVRPRCDNPYAHAGVENSADACAFVRARCPQRSGVISYQKLVFCQLGGASQARPPRPSLRTPALLCTARPVPSLSPLRRTRSAFVCTAGSAAAAALARRALHLARARR